MDVMPTPSVQEGKSQADFIKDEMNFDVDPEDPQTQAALKDHEKDENIDILGNGQLKKKVIKLGEAGTRPNRSEICCVNIVGKLEDGTIAENHEDLTIQLGDVEVVQGLDLAIALMNVGEEAEIEVASRFAYGDKGCKTEDVNVPPGATIFYTVTLKSVELEDEIDTLSVEKRREIGNKKRERGNWWFSRDEQTLAIQAYRRALEFLLPEKDGTSPPEETEQIQEPPSDADLQILMEDRMKVYNNLAAAQMKTQAYNAALESVENVLRCQPQNMKALFRKGKILHFKGEHATASATLQQALKLDPESKAIQQELAILKEKNAKDARYEKNLYKKMLGTNKSSKEAEPKHPKETKPGRTTGKLMLSLVGGATAAVIGILVAYRFAY